MCLEQTGNLKNWITRFSLKKVHHSHKYAKESKVSRFSLSNDLLSGLFLTQSYWMVSEDLEYSME